MYKKFVLSMVIILVSSGMIYSIVEAQSRQRNRRTSRSRITNKTLPNTDSEKKILGVLDDIYQNQSQGMMNVPPDDGRMLRILAESTNAKRIVEIGTSNGYSGLWFCLALKSTGGKLITHDIDARRAALARQNFKRAGVNDIVTLNEGDAHQLVTKLTEPIDILFIDADKEGYPDYLKKLLPLVRPGGLIIAHNVNTQTTRGGLYDYIAAVTTDAKLDTVFFEMAGGLSITIKKRPLPN